MNGALSNLRRETAELLSARGVPAVTAFEPAARKRLTEPTAAVSLAKVVCAAGGFRDYLGLRTDPETGETEELYGRAVELTLSLDIYGPRDSGETACRETLDRMTEVLAAEGAAGLSVLSLESGNVEFLDSCGMYRLPVRCECRAWLTAVVREDGEFVDFRVKGRTV